MKGIATAGLFV